MQQDIFPKNWLLRLKSVEELALRLSISADYLLNLERKIPLYYHWRTILTGDKERTLSIPTFKLKVLQRRILDNILNFNFPDYIHGGVPDRSIITNARTHLFQKWVMCLDIKDFFPSVHYKRIYNSFIRLECSSRIAELLTHFVTYGYQLPQGAPTSPIIANMVLYNLDQRLFGLCRVKRFKYSRYFDDITISGCYIPELFIKKCKLIIKQEGFKINPKKLHIMPFTKNQLVTGLLVNGGKLQASPKEIKKIQEILDKILLGNFSIFINEEPIKIKATMEGHLAFLKSVDPPMAKILEQKLRKISWGSFCI